MNLFVCFRSVDEYEGLQVINRLKASCNSSLVILEEAGQNLEWKKSVFDKISSAHFVVFLLGETTFKSEHIRWEYNKAVALNKTIIGIKLSGVSEASLLSLKEYSVFDNVDESLEHILTVVKPYAKIAI
ncbi:MAG: TIR domain-containing protein [Muriicola sp.]|nr:TIR domain-containing protein [Muriicola sp.]